MNTIRPNPGSAIPGVKAFCDPQCRPDLDRVDVILGHAAQRRGHLGCNLLGLPDS